MLEHPNPQIELTDLGNARRLVARHGENVRHVPPWRKWLVWDGRRWCQDETGEIERLAKETVVALYNEASSDLLDKEKRLDLVRHAQHSEAEPRLRAMIRLAQSEPGIPVLPKDFDSDRYLFNVNNGTLDLKTGQLRAQCREDLITKLAPVDYQPDATCPTWDKFIHRIMAGDQEMIHYLRRALGYSLTGDTCEQCLFIGVGKGNNGKTTLLEVVRATMGGYAIQAETKTLLERGRDGIPNDVARLAGARFIAAAEAKVRSQLACSVVKTLTGGDTILARYLYGEFFQFEPQGKWFLAVNHLPEVEDSTDSMWRRIKVIDFPVSIPADERDKHLKEKLLMERSGILRWMV